MALSKAEQAEYDQLKSGTPQPSQGGSLTPAEQAEYASLKGAPGAGGAKPSGAQAALEGFGQGASLGYLPQLQAATEPAMNKVLDLFTGNNVSDQTPDYVTRRDENIKRNKSLAEAHPLIYGGSQLAGGLAATAALPGGSATSTLGKIGQGAVSGAALGLASNPGDVEGVVDPLQMSERAKDAGIMGTIGAASPLIPAGFNALKNGTNWLAERSAFKALGPYARAVQNTFNKGEVNNMGRTALDTGIIGKVLPKGYEAMENTANQVKATVGPELEAQLQKLDAMGREQGVTIDRQKIADEARKRLLIPEEGVPGAKAQNAQVEKLIQEFESKGEPATPASTKEVASGVLDANGNPLTKTVEVPGSPGTPGAEQNLPLYDAEMLKRGTGRMVNFNRLKGADVPVPEQVNKQLSGSLKREVEATGNKLADMSGSDAGQKFRAAKQTYGNAADASEILALRKSKDLSNRFLSPSDYGAGGVGAVIGAAAPADDWQARIEHIGLGATAGVANKLMRLYGPQYTARAMNLAAKMAGRAAQVTKNPWAVSSMARQALPGANNELDQLLQEKQ